MSNEQAIERKQSVPRDKFIETWATKYAEGGSVQDVADALGMNLGSCQGRATGLRKKGIMLPKFKGGRTAVNVDVNEANARLAAIMGITVEQLTAQASGDDASDGE